MKAPISDCEIFVNLWITFVSSSNCMPHGRVHCHWLGHTIVGDYTYSGRTDVLSPRMFLHAHRLVCRKHVNTPWY